MTEQPPEFASHVTIFKGSETFKNSTPSTAFAMLAAQVLRKNTFTKRKMVKPKTSVVLVVFLRQDVELGNMFRGEHEKQ